MTVKVNGIELTDAAVSYLETILWAETVSLPMSEEELFNGYMDVPADHPLHGILECEPLDDYFGIAAFSVESLQRAQKDCDDFFLWLENADLLDRAREFASDDRIAHDFWLTRNGHGAGFWDGDYADDTDDVGDALSDSAKYFGECWVIIGDDGLLHIDG